jgi:hypothetical protein
MRMRLDTFNKRLLCKASNFRENSKREAIADSYSRNRLAKAAREFSAKRWGPFTSLHESRAYGPQNF